MKKTNVVLIGGGIMSATLGVLLKELQTDTTIEIFERLDDVALESSDTLNNAGTGHSAFCELNYSPLQSDGSIRIDKAIEIAESFEISKQFWASLLKKHALTRPNEFINTVPHMSWGQGEHNAAYIKKRYETLSKETLFQGMEYADSPKMLEKWIPLMMKGRKDNVKRAASRMEIGTDINFGTLTRQLFTYLKKSHNISLRIRHEVTSLRQVGNTWQVFVTDNNTYEEKVFQADFVFIGAGGAALKLLQKSGIPEGKGYGGFPVNGNFLICTNPDIAKEHNAKVYGIPSLNTPPMSVPHLDTRMINGKRELLFGPFAGFSTKFLKRGSYLDFPQSLQVSNILPILEAGVKNIPLTTYLIGQLLLTDKERISYLREFIPEAKGEDWKLYTAGQRVQIIKPIPGRGGTLQFGTEVISSKDGTLAALLGASPGASTSVKIMLELVKKCFPKQFAHSSWQRKIKELIPSYGRVLSKDKKLSNEMRKYSHSLLKLRFA